MLLQREWAVTILVCCESVLEDPPKCHLQEHMGLSQAGQYKVLFNSLLMRGGETRLEQREHSWSKAEKPWNKSRWASFPWWKFKRKGLQIVSLYFPLLAVCLSNLCIKARGSLMIGQWHWCKLGWWMVVRHPSVTEGTQALQTRMPELELWIAIPWCIWVNLEKVMNSFRAPDFSCKTEEIHFTLGVSISIKVLALKFYTLFWPWSSLR